MAQHSEVPPAAALSPPPLSRTRGLVFLDDDDLGERRPAASGAGASLTRVADPPAARPQPAQEPPAQPAPWFAVYRLSFSCDLEILDEAH